MARLRHPGFGLLRERSVSHGLGDQMRARAGAELAHRAVHVLAHGVVRDVQCDADLLAGRARGNHPDHLALALGEPPESVTVCTTEVTAPARDLQCDEQHETSSGDIFGVDAELNTDRATV